MACKMATGKTCDSPASNPKRVSILQNMNQGECPKPKSQRSRKSGHRGSGICKKSITLIGLNSHPKKFKPTLPNFQDKADEHGEGEACSLLSPTLHPTIIKNMWINLHLCLVHMHKEQAWIEISVL